MTRVRYQLTQCEEDRKQLYWGAFVLGGAAFHSDRRAGCQQDDLAVSARAQTRFHQLILTAPEGMPYVDDELLGLACFTEAFLAGYHQQAVRFAADRLPLN